jgi:hypothetical protein
MLHEQQSSVTAQDAANVETMPTDACGYFHECHACGMRLRPKAGGLLCLLILWFGPLSADAGRGLLPAPSV